MDLLEKIRQFIMEKFDLRQQIAATTFIGHIIIPKVMKMLHAKSKDLDMEIVKRSTYEAEITTVDNFKSKWPNLLDISTLSFLCQLL